MGTPPAPQTAPRGTATAPRLGLALQQGLGPPRVTAPAASGGHARRGPTRGPLPGCSYGSERPARTPRGFIPSAGPVRRPAGRRPAEGRGRPRGPRGPRGQGTWGGWVLVPPQGLAEAAWGVHLEFRPLRSVSAPWAGAALSFRAALPSGDRVPPFRAEHPVPRAPAWATRMLLPPSGCPLPTGVLPWGPCGKWPLTAHPSGRHALSSRAGLVFCFVLMNGLFTCLRGPRGSV